jgi:hypothetical protein
MLETKQQGEEDWDLVVEAVEWSDIVFVFAIQRPNVGSNKVDIILR